MKDLMMGGDLIDGELAANQMMEAELVTRRVLGETEGSEAT